MKNIILLTALLLFSCQPVETDYYGFPADFPELPNTGGRGQGEPLQGFGGAAGKNRQAHRQIIEISGKRPVILLHGNGGRASYWLNSEATGFSLYNGLKQKIYTDAHIWAVSYLGEPPLRDRSGPARKNMEDVRRFIDAVREYTGSEKVDIIALSLGAHMARGYILGLQADGSFDPQDRRLDAVGSMILISGANYGLGKLRDSDWNSRGPLFDDGRRYQYLQNNFTLFDGEVDLTPGDIHYYCLYARYDFPQALYEWAEGGHPLAPENTSRLGDADYFEIPPDYGGNEYYIARYDDPWYGSFERPNPYIALNHKYSSRDAQLFEDYIFPNLDLSAISR